jgi:ABC-type nitrate/sulfonate/bicarbonate transport system ATPase subunit
VTHNIEEAVLMSCRILVLGSNPGRILLKTSSVQRAFPMQSPGLIR